MSHKIKRRNPCICFVVSETLNFSWVTSRSDVDFCLNHRLLLNIAGIPLASRGGSRPSREIWRKCTGRFTTHVRTRAATTQVLNRHNCLFHKSKRLIHEHQKSMRYGPLFNILDVSSHIII